MGRFLLGEETASACQYGGRERTRPKEAGSGIGGLIVGPSSEGEEGHCRVSGVTSGGGRRTVPVGKGQRCC